ncbi:MAG: tetratricopeptide repeat protein [Mycetocola sp.]
MSSDRYSLPPAGSAPQAASAAPGAQPADTAGVIAVPSLVAAVTEENFQGFVELSAQLPLVVLIRSAQDLVSAELSPVLENAVLRHEGRLLLLTVEAEQSPGIAQAFQVQSVPTVVAVIGGRPVPLFAGQASAEQIDSLLGQLLELAAQSGVSARAQVADEDAEPEPLPPLHQEAYDAIARGDFAAAITAYETAIKQQPTDSDAVAGLAQVQLLSRMQGRTIDEIRSAAAANPADVSAQLAVADLDVSGGHIEDAFDRLLTLFADADADARTPLRERLLDYFQVVGVSDPRVAAARSRLTNLLF